MRQIKHVLFVRLDYLGDLVLSLPAVFAFKKSHPGSFITLAINARNELLVKGLTYIDEVIPVETVKFSGLLKACRKIKKRQYDFAVHLMPGKDWKGALLIAASGAKNKLGYNVGLFSLFLTHKISPSVLKYEMENVFEIFEHMGEKLDFCGWGLTPSASAEIRLINKLKEFGVTDSFKMVVVHPGVSVRGLKKNWPVERFESLVFKLITDMKVTVALIGNKEEQSLSVSIKRANPGVVNLCGSLTLDELVQLINHCRLFVGCNSGPMHIAVALDIPTVSLMGPSLFTRWAPRGEKHIVIRKKLECSPCEGTSRECSENTCMKNITVEEVFQAAKTQLRI